MVTCTQIPVTIPTDGSALSNDTIHTIISAILPLEWPPVDPAALHVTHHTGYANTNCVVARPSSSSSTSSSAAAAAEPLKVFLKINGALDGEIAVFAHLVPDKHQEAQLCHDYGQSGRGAQMHGFFQTSDGAYGRVDEFLEARTLTPHDVEDAAIRADVARAQAAFHAQTTQRARKKPVAEYYATLTRALARYRGLDKLKQVGRGAGVAVDNVVDYDFASRIERIVARLEGMRAKTGWCIHDVQYMNTMLRTTDTLKPGQHRAVLIDFEFVFANYRGVDIGGHFLHKLFQWFDASSKLTGARPYSAAERAHYCRVYAAQWNAETKEEESTGEAVEREAELGYMLAIAFEVHNMMNYMDEEGEEDAMEMEALRRLFGEFVDQFERLGLEDEMRAN